MHSIRTTYMDLLLEMCVNLKHVEKLVLVGFENLVMTFSTLITYLQKNWKPTGN